MSKSVIIQHEFEGVYKMEGKIDLQKEEINNWKKAYCENLDSSNYQILNLTGHELIKFYQHNYYDDAKECFVMEKNLDKYVPIGMTTLSFLPNEELNYLIMVCKNQLGLETIVASMEYVDKFHKRDDESKEINTKRIIHNIDFNKYVTDIDLIGNFLVASLKINEKEKNYSKNK